jgi:hypothetical protein
MPPGMGSWQPKGYATVLRRPGSMASIERFHREFGARWRCFRDYDVGQAIAKRGLSTCALVLAGLRAGLSGA